MTDLGYERGLFPGRCKAKRVAGVSSPGRRMLAELAERAAKYVAIQGPSKRWERQLKKRVLAADARVKHGLLPKRLCR